mmetsp:Transcript_39312/g.98330  ORF Transcript_39312/g.98330 Transcript_39312/m.98330 type:complete len:213 (+) Transcript_39312:2095-2733(+)
MVRGRQIGRERLVDDCISERRIHLHNPIDMLCRHIAGRLRHVIRSAEAESVARVNHQPLLAEHAPPLLIQRRQQQQAAGRSPHLVAKQHVLPQALRLPTEDGLGGQFAQVCGRDGDGKGLGESAQLLHHAEPPDPSLPVAALLQHTQEPQQIADVTHFTAADADKRQDALQTRQSGWLSLDGEDVGEAAACEPSVDASHQEGHTDEIPAQPI